MMSDRNNDFYEMNNQNKETVNIIDYKNLIKEKCSELDELKIKYKSLKRPSFVFKILSLVFLIWAFIISVLCFVYTFIGIRDNYITAEDISSGRLFSSLISFILVIILPLFVLSIIFFVKSIKAKDYKVKLGKQRIIQMHEELKDSILQASLEFEKNNKPRKCSISESEFDLKENSFIVNKDITIPFLN